MCRSVSYRVDVAGLMSFHAFRMAVVVDVSYETPGEVVVYTRAVTRAQRMPEHL